MNNNATMEKMQKLKLYGMLKAFQNTMGSGVKKNFTLDEMIGHLVESEWEDWQNRRFSRYRQYARFRYSAVFEEIDFSVSRNLDKNELLRLSNCSWLEKKNNMIITGPTGVGKSFIACALGHQACLYEYRVLYFNCLKLFSEIKQSQADGTDRKKLKRILKSDLLIIDDFGLQVFDEKNRLKLFEILEDRHGLKSTLIVSQIPVSKWHQVIGDETLADAICDRLVHTAIRIDLKGDSIRKIKEKS